MKPVLYITYDGLLDPLGRSQVVPYVTGLARRGVPLAVLSFEKMAEHSAGELESLMLQLGELGVLWRHLPYHKRPPVLSTVWDILRGFLAAGRMMLRARFTVLHARSYIAGAICLLVRGFGRAGFLFDMRGFWADERVEGGLWREGGALYRFFKRLEKRLFARADAIVILTRRGAEMLPGMLPGRNRDPRITVIPTCADLDRFRMEPLPVFDGNGLRLVYAGSLGTWYMIDRMLELFGRVHARLPESVFTVLTRSDTALLDRALESASLSAGVAGRVRVKGVPYEQVADELHDAHFSVFFIRPTFSKQASCATKFAESLACGRPVVINPGIGDHDEHVRRNGAGVVLEEFGAEHYDSAVESMLELLGREGLAERCRAVAEEHFSLGAGIDRYMELYSFIHGRAES